MVGLMAVAGTTEAPVSGLASNHSRPVFLLGVGCQKGGTTWLHSQLAKCPAVDMGFTKEYHIFDAKYIPGCDDKLRERHGRLRAKLNTRQPAAVARSAQLLRLLGFHADLATYYDYFQLLALRNSSVRVVGDITPAYAGLPAKALRQIRAELEAHGFHVKVIFLMRDPVERLWSMVRGIRRKQRHRDPTIRFERSEAELLLEKAALPRNRLMTDYRATIANLEAVFPAEDIFYGFYEALFTPEAAARIGAFLQIAFHPDFDVRIHASPKLAGDLSGEVIAQVARLYRDVYSFCAERFPEAALVECWEGYRYLS
jgi:hypothetical protein